VLLHPNFAGAIQASDAASASNAVLWGTLIAPLALVE
jgi:hypothetical protein